MRMSATIFRSLPPRGFARAGLRRLRLAMAAALLGVAACSAYAAPNGTLIVADFTGDGIPAALVPSTSSPSPLLSLGTVPFGSFNPQASIVSFGAGCSSLIPGTLATGDFNGDGLPDLAFACQTGSTSTLVGVLIGNGDGTFGAPQIVSGATSSTFVVGDFNHDGKLDLVTVGSLNPPGAGLGIQFFAGNGDGTFAAGVATAFAGNTGYTAPVAVDLNHDGFPDLVLGRFFTQSGDTLGVFGNNQDGTFGVVASGAASPNTTLSIGSYPNTASQSILAGSFYAQGGTDLAVVDAGSTPGVYLVKNTSTAGGFSLASPVKAIQTTVLGAAVASFTGSPATDLLLTDGASLTVYTNDGTGNFSPAYAGLRTSNLTGFYAAADANGDGYADLYVATPGPASVQITVNLVSGSATATSNAGLLAPGAHPLTATWAGNTNFLGSTANGSLPVSGFPTMTVLTSSANPVALAPVTLTAMVTLGSAIDNVPGGTITFSDGTTVLGSGAVNGAAPVMITTSTLTAGLHNIVATYSGDSFFAGSSALLALSVAPAAATVAWPTPAPIVYGTPLGPMQLDATAVDANNAAVPGTFAYTPPAGTVLNAGTQTLSVVFTPTDPALPVGGATTTLVVTKATPRLSWATPAPITAGVPLGAAQLNATAAGISGAPLPGTFTYSPAAGAVLAAGTQTLNVAFVPTDSANYTAATASVQLVVNPLAVTLTSISPNTANLGDGAKTITLTGSGFVQSSVVKVNGVAVPTTPVNATTLTAVVPATDFAAPGALSVTVVNSNPVMTSAAQTLTVSAPTPALTLTGPSTTPPGSQPTLTLTITNPYPVDLTAVFTLSFASLSNPPIDDPSIQFANGGRTFSFVVAANTTLVPTIQLQSGTVAGTITIPLHVMAGGVDVTPPSVQPIVIVVPAAVPFVSTNVISRSGGQLTVAVHGFSNTREVTQATFHFTNPAGGPIDTPDVVAPVGPLFTTWFSSPQSAQYGSSFTYTQIFNVSDDATNIGSVQVTLTNTVGTSAAKTGQ